MFRVVVYAERRRRTCGRQAKELLQQWCEQHARSRDAAELRRDLARQCDLDTLAQKCTAFDSFLRKLQLPRA